MKKLKAIIVSLCLVLALSACGKSEETYTAEELANMSEKELAEIMEQQEKEEKSDKKNKPGKADEPSQEILDAEWYSGKVQIDGIVIDLPTTVHTLLDLGFEARPYDGFEEDYLYAQNEGTYAFFFLDGKEVFHSNIKNSLEGYHTFADIIAETDPIINDMLGATAEDVTYYYPGGLKKGDSFTLIEERLGAPTKKDVDGTYHYGRDDVYFRACKTTINTDFETQKITSITTFAKTNPTELSKDSLETVTFDNLVCSMDDSVHTLSLKMLPGWLMDSDDFEATFLLDGELYSFVMYCNMLNYSPDKYTTYILNETDDAGVTRTLDQFYDFTVCKNGYQLDGTIEVKNLAKRDADYAYSNELFQEIALEIIRSIQFE